MSIGIIAAHDVIGGGGGATAYWSTLLALSPWGAWKTNETSGSTLADSSGNSRPMTTFGSPGPTLAQTGPGASPIADAISWGNVTGQTAATQSATTNAGAFTHVCWFKLAANPSGNLAVQARATDYGSGSAADGEFYISSDGKMHFHVFDTSAHTIDSASAVTLGTWHMAAASVGAAGMKLRVDKITVASNGAVTTGFTGSGQKVLMRGGGSGFTVTSPIVTARHAYFTSQLSDASTDSLFDAA